MYIINYSTEKNSCKGLLLMIVIEN